jgi:pseudaminic acid synthase
MTSAANRTGSPAAVAIEGRPIGIEHPPYVIAELSGNHNADIGRAFALIEAAYEAGADAVKLQTYTADTITIDHDGPGFVIQDGLWRGRRLHDLYREAHTPWDWHPRLFEKAKSLGITMFSSPFDPTAVDFLASLAAPAYKIASFEIVDVELIKYAAATDKPLIVSTGMASLEEIADGFAAAKSGCGGVVLLHCVSGYPTPASDANLATIGDMADRFGVPIGLSDHTLGTSVAVAAVAVGACVIEKHVTLSREDGGPDAAFSLEPDELARLCADCRSAWQALGRVNYDREASEKDIAALRRSLYVVADIAPGEMFTERNIRSIRPGYGLAPKHLQSILGRRAGRLLRCGTPLAWTDIANPT